MIRKTLTDDGRPPITPRGTFKNKKPRTFPLSAGKDLRGLLVIFFFTLWASARYRLCPFSFNKILRGSFISKKYILRLSLCVKLFCPLSHVFRTLVVRRVGHPAKGGTDRILSPIRLLS